MKRIALFIGLGIIELGGVAVLAVLGVAGAHCAFYVCLDPPYLTQLFLPDPPAWIYWPVGISMLLLLIVGFGCLLFGWCKKWVSAHWRRAGELTEKWEDIKIAAKNQLLENWRGK